MTTQNLFSEPRPEPEDGCFSLRRYATCDLCGTKEAPGDLHHHHGVPVLFMCDDCDTSSPAVEKPTGMGMTK
jgi:hypothetical protein